MMWGWLWRTVQRFVGRKPMRKRSPHWPEARADHLKKNPRCAACGRTDYLAVHHKKPFHLFPYLELSPGNLLTLCEHPKWSCHLHVGHGGNWSHYVENVEATAEGVRMALSWRKIFVPNR